MLTGFPFLFGLAPFRNAYLVRAMLMWVLLRAAATWIEIGAGNPVVSATVVGFVTAGVYLDARKRQEDLFLANLGVSGGSVMLLAAISPTLLELGLLALLWR